MDKTYVFLGDFGTALAALRDQVQVRRHSWDEGLFLSYQAGYPQGIPINSNTAQATGVPEGTVCHFAHYLLFGDGRHFAPWGPTHADLLAEDWETA